MRYTQWHTTGSVLADARKPADSADPVTSDYAGSAPWAFTGGTIKRVAIDVSGERYVDLEREAVAMMSRE